MDTISPKEKKRLLRNYLSLLIRVGIKKCLERSHTPTDGATPQGRVEGMDACTPSSIF